jgi:Flp pilus assembly protein TadB
MADPERAMPPTGRLSRSGPAVAGLAVGGACVAVVGGGQGVVAGAVLASLAYAGLACLRRRPPPAPPDPALPLVLDLIAAALRGGRPLADALVLAAGAARIEVAAELRQVAGLSRLGADAGQAWSVIAAGGPLSAVAPVAVRSARSGIKIAAAFERLAAELRAEQAARRAARAQRAGVLALGPLAACFLPSFLCLGVVPVIAGIASSAFGVLPGTR